tara:strand:- start:693 stop:869 length:177 start_codon:yes stop_codon:yes gene_type:complete
MEGKQKYTKKLYNLISKESDLQDKLLKKTLGEKYYISVGKTIGYSKAISLIEKPIERI